MTAAPRLSSSRATVDFPAPMPPASPMIGFVRLVWSRDKSVLVAPFPLQCGPSRDRDPPQSVRLRGGYAGTSALIPLYDRAIPAADSCHRELQGLSCPVLSEPVTRRQETERKRSLHGGETDYNRTVNPVAASSIYPGSTCVTLFSSFFSGDLGTPRQGCENQRERSRDTLLNSTLLPAGSKT